MWPSARSNKGAGCPARQLALPLPQIREIHLAALLHDLGKVGFPRHLIETPNVLLEGEDRYLLQQHPERGQRSISAVADLIGVAKLVRFHHERFDGHGFLDGIMRDMIPPVSRIIAVAEDFDELQMGWLTEQPLSEAQALAAINKKCGTRYDPSVVAVLKQATYRLKTSPQPGEALRNASNLKSGMVLSRDLISPDGLLLQLSGNEGEVSVFAAIKPDTHEGWPTAGTKGCFYSHLGVIEAAIAEQATAVLILEDDWFETTQPIMLAHSYLVSGSCLPRLRDYLHLLLSRPSGHPDGGPMHYDGALNMFKQQNPDVVVKLANPSFTFQRRSKSDISTGKYDQMPVAREFLALARRVRYGITGR